VQIYLACECRDTDLWVRLLDVAPDGTAFNLMSPGLEVLRASYRNQKKGRQLLAPHRVYELHLDNLITSNVFRKDHRIRMRPRKFVGTNAEGKHFDLYRPPSTFTHYFADRSTMMRK
jgi:predicted acyl esterase